MKYWYFLLLGALAVFRAEASGRFLASIREAAQVPVVYGVSPFYFTENDGKNSLREIRKRLPEIRELGANILWLQPIFPSAQPGQGYDTMDAFRIHAPFGSEADFKALVKDAHARGMKVILDVALNHLPQEHPFAQDVIKKGKASKYADFFQSEINPGHAYSRHAHQVKIGKGDFVHYFWKTFLNLNYDSPRVREYALSVLEFWMTRYQVDGYRLDAAWGPQNRWPGFYRAVSEHLRRINPDVFILAEDHVSFPRIYDGRPQPHLGGSRIKAAYDWDAQDPDFVSKWNFQMGDEHDATLFNSESPEEAAKLFVKQVREQSEAPQAEPLRFLQNNDGPSFLQNHTLEQTKAAAAAIMLLPGVPLIYYGQELGLRYEQWHLPTLDPKRKLKSYHAELWDFYKGLLELKQSNEVFRHGKLVSIRTRPGGQVEYSLEKGGRKEIIRINFKTYDVKLNGKPLEKYFLSPRRCGAVFG